MSELHENPYVALALAQATPDEAKKIAAALRSAKDQAPGAQAATNVLPQASLDQLTSRFDVTRIPMSRLEQMGSDPTIAFAEFFVKAMILQARWMIKCSDPQVAAYVDQALREIYPSLVSQYLKKLRFGFQAIIKRFETREALDWTYSDPLDETSPEKPVWSEGSILPVLWKPFAAPGPTTVEPLWTPDGSFNGIKYKPVSSGGSDSKEAEFDVLHSLWVTNEKEKVHGSLWGFPRIGYAYRFWWSFWFNWGLADRHFEKDADPPAIVYYPSNKPDIIAPNGDVISRRKMALNLGDQIRSGATAAIPSDLIIGDDGLTKPVREWEIKWAEGAGNFEVFAARFDQLRRFMLQACMVPEEAFTAKGGTAGYNSTGQQMDAFQMSQIVLLAELDFDINHYLIPQLIAANFPEREGIKATKVTKGFDTDDIELAKIIIQGAANSDVNSLNLDMESMLDAVGIPRLSASAIAKKNAEAAAAAQETAPDPVAAVSGEAAGVNEQGLYYAPRELITLSSADEEQRATFMAELTSIAALRDPIILSDAQRMRNLWHTSLQYDLSIANNLLHDFRGNVNLDEDFIERFYRRVKSRAHDTASQTRRALSNIMRRASTTEIAAIGLADFSWDPLYSDRASTFLSERVEVMTDKITKTTRDQIKVFLADLIKKDVPHEQFAPLLNAHFRMYSSWRADQIVRTEIGFAYNMATLLAAEDAGIKQVQALDAQLGPDRSDPHCIDRNGKVFTLKQAFIELFDEHPNGTLQFRLLKKPVKVKRLPIPKGAPAGILANFEETDDQVIVHLSEGITPAQEQAYLISVINRVQNDLAIAA